MKITWLGYGDQELGLLAY